MPANRGDKCQGCCSSLGKKEDKGDELDDPWRAARVEDFVEVGKLDQAGHGQAVWWTPDFGPGAKL